MLIKIVNFGNLRSRTTPMGSIFFETGMEKVHFSIFCYAYSYGDKFCLRTGVKSLLLDRILLKLQSNELIVNSLIRRDINVLVFRKKFIKFLN